MSDTVEEKQITELSNDISTNKKLTETAEDAQETFDLNILNVYRDEPPIDFSLFHDMEFCTSIIDVLDRNSKLEHLEKMRIRKLTTITTRYLSQYSNFSRDRCRFCSSIAVPFLNPHYTCTRCWRLVCKTCLFIIEWNDKPRVICAHCLCTINTDNRTGKWFTILMNESDRKSISPKSYLMPLMQKRKKITIKKERIRGKWVPIDEALAEWNEDEERTRKKSRTQSLSNDSQQFSGSERRESSISQDLQNYIPPETVTLAINYDQEESTFQINLRHCQNLPLVKDKLPNPYIKFNIEPEYLNKKKKPRTKTILENRNPLFDELLAIRISHSKIKNGNLIIAVCHLNKKGKDLILGEVIIPINQTLNSSKGKFQTYRLKSTETILSTMADKKLRITRMMDSLSRAPLYYEKESTTFYEPDKDMFESETWILTKIKCDLVKKTSKFNVNLYLDTFTDIQKIIESATVIQLAGMLKKTDGSEVVLTEKLTAQIESVWEPLLIDSKLIFPNLDSDLDFNSIELQLQVFSDNGDLIAESYNSTTNFLRKIKMDQGIWFPINFKLRRL